MIYYNTYRKNRNKDKKSPCQILEEHCERTKEKIMTKKLCMFKPIVVDKYINDIDFGNGGGNFKWSAPTFESTFQKLKSRRGDFQSSIMKDQKKCIINNG
jgi:hypothetical protein